MKRDADFSEEQLNAFVDGELDPEEKSRLYNESSRSPELDHRLCQHRKLKELVRYAYDDAPMPDVSYRTRMGRSSGIWRSLVAGVLLAAGAAVGLAGHALIGNEPSELTAAEATGQVTEPENFLLHVISGEPEQMRAALDYARFLLESDGERSVGRVEIVANEQGLDLLRSDVTPFASEVADLQRRSVVFYACSRTIERLEEQGIDVTLLPEARREYTALDRVVMRMQAGWTYQKI